MAYKEKEHDYKKLEKDLTDGRIDELKAVLLFGHEDYLIKFYEEKIRNLYIEPAASKLDYVMLDGESATADEIISHGDTLPMLSTKRIVAVRNHPFVTSAVKKNSSGNTNGEKTFVSDDDVKRLTEYMEDIPETTLLVFLAEKIDTRKALSKKIAKVGKSYNFDRLDRKGLASFIRKRFKEEDKKVSDSVVKEIINATGYFDRDSDYNLNGIAGDIVKIASFSNDREITEADVSSVLTTSLETDAFALLDVLSKGNKGDALLLLNNILDAGESGFKLLGLIISQFELMLGIKEYSARNMNKAEIMNEMGIKSEFRYKKVSAYTNLYSIEKMNGILKSLYEVEKNIKTGIYNEKLAMTMFVAGI